MNMLKSVFLLLCISVTGFAYAQTQELSGFKRLSSSSITPIYEGKEVKGYTLFYKTDKADRGNDNYHISIYDENLALSKTINMQKPRDKFFLIGSGYNGDLIGFYFYNFKDKRFEIEAYDKSLKKTASSEIIHKLTNMEMAIMQKKLADADKDLAGYSYDVNLYPVAGKGFITNGLLKNGKGFTLEMLDNSLKSKWKIGTDEKSKEYEAFVISDVTDKFIIGSLIKRPGMMSKKMTFYITAFDVNTGKKFMEVPLEGSVKDQLSLNSISYDENTKQIITIGDYYNESDKPGVSKSKGFYIKTFDDQGKETNMKFFSWDKDVKSLLPAEAKPSLEKGAMNFTHKILRGQDGKFYLVCEQFSTGTDGAGIALNVLGGGYGASMTKAVVWNMFIYALNPDFTLNEIKFYAKDKSNVTLPAGADFYGSGMIGMITKAVGGFDYQFTQMTNDGKSFNVVFINYDKEKGETTKRMLGNIIISPDGKFNLDKIDITTKASSSFLYPAKPGYLMMVDHLRKEKTVGMKLIKLNY